MATEYIHEVVGQPSIYDPQLRKFKLYFDVPDNVDENTGILLFIAGFGAHSNSNIYKKMRKLFAEEYNLVTVQCEYFGWQYMQMEVLEESRADFCDMGPCQAMDNLIALKYVKDYLEDNGIPYSRRKVIAYGHSHGSYLALLMNSFMPDVFSFIIDNSAWLFPVYIHAERGFEKTRFHYLISEIIIDDEIYDLEKRYMGLDNHSMIVSFQGMLDTLVSPAKKMTFTGSVKNMSIELIGEPCVDGVAFRSIGHAMDSDFIEIFKYVNGRYRMEMPEDRLIFDERRFETSKCVYEIISEDGIPFLICYPKEG